MVRVAVMLLLASFILVACEAPSDVDPEDINREEQRFWRQVGGD